MEFGTLSGLSDGGASALTRGEDIISHQTKTNQENGLLGNRNICNACTGHRAVRSGTTYLFSGRGEAGPMGK
jgi:hypothetical protein